MQDLLDEKILKKKIVAAMEPKRLSLRPFAKDPALDLHSMTEEYLTYGHRLEQHIADTAAARRGTRSTTASIVLFEGAQGALLDIDHGTYPFVTSSNPVAGAACVGAGVGPKDIDEVWGIAKAYATRVGAGPFPTELHDEIGEPIRAGAAASSARRPAAPRRTGWLDLVALRYAARMNSLTALVDHQARRAHRPRPRSRSARATAAPRTPTFDDFPYHQSVLHHATRRATSELPGWSEDIGECRTRVRPARRPRATTCDFIAELVGVPVALIGVGPGRDAGHLDRRPAAATPRT